jgi:hypothetical protein
MDTEIFQQKMNDLRQKLSSINDDIVEIQKNQKIIKNKTSFAQNDASSIKNELNNSQRSQMLMSNQNKSLNNEKNLETILSKDSLFNSNLTIPAEAQQPISNKKIFINKNFYKKLKNNRIQKKDDIYLNKENKFENIFENKNANQINSKCAYTNTINHDEEISFGKLNNENIKDINNFRNGLNTSRNPLNIKNNKRYNPYSINNLNKERNSEQNKIKNIINHKVNDNIMINNNNTICITYDNRETIQRDKNNMGNKIIPLTKKNDNIRKDVFNFYSILSPNKNLINSRTGYFETKLIKKRNKNKLNNLSKEQGLIRNETQTQIPNKKIFGIGSLENSGDLFGSVRLLKSNRIDDYKDNKNKKLEIIENTATKYKRRIKLIDFQNKKKFNSMSFNKLMISRNIKTDRPNKIIKNKNKIFNTSDNDKNINIYVDKEKLIKKINKQIYTKHKKNKSFNISNSLSQNKFLSDIIRDKNENEISSNIVQKLNQNIFESKMKNNFIMKLIKLYYDSTGMNINKENDLNSTLSILYNWIENITKINNTENRANNEEMQYKRIRNNIMNQYRIKNKKELKSFLTKILGNDS